MHPDRVLQLRVALTASDYTRLVEFYCVGLGIEPTETWTNEDGHGVMLELGRATVELFDDGYAAYIDHVEFGERISGPVRLALQVPDVAGAVDRLVRHGATLVHGPVLTPWGDHSARVEAPDGLQVTLFQQGEADMEAPRSDVRLRAYSDGDLGLLRSLLGDAKMTRFLGGPESEQALADRHQRYLHSDPETSGLFVIVVGESQLPAGWVGFWESEWDGEVTWECGWHVLEAFQGSGVATSGARLALEEARSRGKHRYIDAFPACDNAASNALCERLGFTLLGDVEVEYPKGHAMRSMHWRLDLQPSESA
jgi:RimJ/RimL family protein N-acetyltransferase/catechol 2,3-dioxygenase-like lactoylglutathione lyase family enzyme